jgi:hypothetical protein
VSLLSPTASLSAGEQEHKNWNEHDDEFVVVVVVVVAFVTAAKTNTGVAHDCEPFTLD